MMLTMRAMKTYPSAQTLGLFDVELRVPWLAAKGNSWRALGSLSALASLKPSSRMRAGAHRRVLAFFAREAALFKGSLKLRSRERASARLPPAGCDSP